MKFRDVISLENLFFAWKEFSRGKKKKKDVAAFDLRLEENLFALRRDLLESRWKPEPYAHFRVRDPKLRDIHKAAVRDRVLYQAVYRALYQVFDRGFIHDSYSSRIGKGTHAGVGRLAAFAAKISRNGTKEAYVLKCDIKKFFDSVDHRILLGLLRKKISDERMLGLLGLIVGSFAKTPGKGLPLGNVTSQIFSNVYLNELDQFVKHSLKAEYYIRYSDDFVILGDSAEYLSAHLSSVRKFCAEKLALAIHPDKIVLRKLHAGIDFLGYVVLPHRIVLRTRTKKRMLRRLEKARGAADEKTAAAAQSYLGMLSHAKGQKIETQIERIFRD